MRKWEFSRPEFKNRCTIMSRLHSKLPSMHCSAHTHTISFTRSLKRASLEKLLFREKITKNNREWWWWWWHVVINYSCLGCFCSAGMSVTHLKDFNRIFDDVNKFFHIFHKSCTCAYVSIIFHKLCLLSSKVATTPVTSTRSTCVHVARHERLGLLMGWNTVWVVVNLVTERKMIF